MVRYHRVEACSGCREMLDALTSFNPFFRELLEFVGYSVTWPWSRLAFRVLASIVGKRLSQKITCKATLL